MALSVPRIVGTYVLCLWIIPIVFVVIYIVVLGLQGSRFDTRENKAKIQQLAAERGVPVHEGMSVEEMKKDLSPEEKEQLQQILNEVAETDFDMIGIISSIIFVLSAACRGMTAGFLLRSLKHVTIIAVTVAVISLVKALVEHVFFASLVRIFVFPFVIFLSGYLTVKRLNNS